MMKVLTPYINSMLYTIIHTHIYINYIAIEACSVGL